MLGKIFPKGNVRLDISFRKVFCQLLLKIAKVQRTKLFILQKYGKRYFISRNVKLN